MRIRAPGRRFTGALAGLALVGTLVPALVVHAASARAASAAELDSSDVSQLSPQWSDPTGSAMAGGPIVYQGSVVAGCDQGLHLCSWSDHTLTWKNTDFSAQFPITSDGGTAYGPTGGATTIGAFDLTTGATLWKTAIPASNPAGDSTSPAEDITDPTVVDGRIFIYDSNQKLDAVNAGTGQLIWSMPEPGYGLWDGQPEVYGSTVFALNGDLYALNAVTGQVEWTVSDLSFAAQSITIHDGSVYILGSAPTGASNVAVVPAAGCGTATCSPTSYIAIPDDYSFHVVESLQFVGSFVVADLSDNLVVLNSRFERLWSNQAGKQVGDTGSPVISDDIILVGEGQYLEAYALDGCGAAVCRPVWSRQLLYAPGMVGPPAVSGTTVYDATGEALYQFGLQPGPFTPPGAPPRPGATAEPSANELRYDVGFSTAVTAGNYPIIGWLVETTDGRYSTTRSPVATPDVSLTIPIGTPASFVVRAITVAGTGLPSPPSSPIVNDGYGFAYGYSAGPTGSLSVTTRTTMAADDTLLAVISAGSTTPVSVTSVTGGGVRWIKAAGESDPAAGDQEIWYATGLPETEQWGVTIQYSSPSATDVGAALYSLVGVDTADPIVTSGTLAGDGTQARTAVLMSSGTNEAVIESTRMHGAITGWPGAPWDGGTNAQTGADGFLDETSWAYSTGQSDYSGSYTTDPGGPWVSAGVILRPAAPLPPTGTPAPSPSAARCESRLPPGTVVGMADAPDGDGYWIASSTGAVTACGDAPPLGRAPSGAAPIAAITASPGLAPGYWLTTQTGHVFAFGAAVDHGSIAPWVRLARPIVAMTADPATGGYWMLGGDGGVFSFDAPFYGSTGNIRLAQPAVGMQATPDGRGYRFVASDGGIFDYGDASFHGSTGGIRLSAPVVGLADDPATGGYWLDAADGGIFAFDAPFYGSTGGTRLAAPCVGMASLPSGDGYRFVAADGGIFSFHAPFEGSAA